MGELGELTLGELALPAPTPRLLPPPWPLAPPWWWGAGERLGEARRLGLRSLLLELEAARAMAGMEFLLSLAESGDAGDAGWRGECAGVPPGVCPNPCSVIPMAEASEPMRLPRPGPLVAAETNRWLWVSIRAERLREHRAEQQGK